MAILLKFAVKFKIILGNKMGSSYKATNEKEL